MKKSLVQMFAPLAFLVLVVFYSCNKKEQINLNSNSSSKPLNMETNNTEKENNALRQGNETQITVEFINAVKKNITDISLAEKKHSSFNFADFTNDLSQISNYSKIDSILAKHGVTDIPFKQDIIALDEAAWEVQKLNFTGPNDSRFIHLKSMLVEGIGGIQNRPLNDCTDDCKEDYAISSGLCFGWAFAPPVFGEIGFGVCLYSSFKNYRKCIAGCGF